MYMYEELHAANLSMHGSNWRPSLIPSLHVHMYVIVQEYRARKRQRLQKKLADQLRTSLQQGQTSASLGGSGDLQQLINSFTGQSQEWAAIFERRWQGHYF